MHTLTNLKHEKVALKLKEVKKRAFLKSKEKNLLFIDVLLHRVTV